MASPEVCTTGARYYVATTASTGSGTLESPFPTIQQAIDVAVPGDVIYVMPGLYPITQRIKTVRGGLSSQRISLVAYDRTNRPVLERSGGYGGEIILIKHPYFLLDGFVMDGKFTAEDYYFKYSDSLRETSYRNVLVIAHYGGFLTAEPSREFYRYGYNGDNAIVRNCEIKNGSTDGVYISAIIFCWRIPKSITALEAHL